MREREGGGERERERERQTEGGRERVAKKDSFERIFGHTGGTRDTKKKTMNFECELGSLE